ncbi:MAG: tRNA lysidine(34) synthetase TilS [Clostridium sp.]|nr:tRNA lysidine(34) synthetase TilS [Clostridium sp.]
MKEEKSSVTYNGELIYKVENTIDKNKMVSKGESIIVALSGGPDSMCLLHILYSLKEKYNIKLYAAHVNHMIRGEESDEDERVCREFCDKLGVELFCLRIDVERLAKERGISTEMAGRDERYKFFETVMEKVNGHKIAVAHNVNDQAETILMHMMRGTGIEGLTGIRAVRDGIFIRPIINITRKEIEEYCNVNKLPVRIDKTNLQPIYARNKVRLEMIPYIEKNFNTDIVSSLNRMSELLRRDEEYLQESAVKVFQRYCYIRQEKVIIYKDAFEYHEAIVSRVVRKAILQLKGNINNIQSIHIENIISLQKNDTGKTTIIPGDIIVSNEYGDLVLKKHITKEKNKEIYFNLKKGKNIIDELGINIYIRDVYNIKKINLRGKSDSKYFDIDGVKNITLRCRKEGDRFIPLGLGGSKKLKDIFIDLKVPREKRDTVPLLCFDDNISWIIGYRVSDKYKVSNNTNNIIEVSVERQEGHE